VSSLRRLTKVFGTAGTWSKPAAMPMDVERNVLTVKAERRPLPGGDDVRMQVSERPLGVFSRRLFLGDSLDTDHITAGYEAGVLTLRIPVVEKAKPRRIEIGGTQSDRKEIQA
jgi:HSP20 family protein